MPDAQSDENPPGVAAPENEPAKQYQPIFLSALSRYDPPLAAEAEKLDQLTSKIAATSKNLSATGANTVTQLNAATEKLQQISEPLRGLYKDESMRAARHETLRKGVPDFVMDTIVAKYYGSKFPTIGVLMKDLGTSGGLRKLEESGHGTSRAQISRWLQVVRTAMENRGLLERKRLPATRPQELGEDLSAQD
jgi:hypothetical protein